jgi:hypothetical protein
MERPDRNRLRSTSLVEVLESRRLLAAGVSGSTGTIRASQFLANIARTVELEHQGLSLRGPLTIHVVTPYQPNGNVPPVPGVAANSGLILRSQFASGGFNQIGAQLRRIRLGAGLTVDDYDETIGQPSGAPPRPVPAFAANTGDVVTTQFNDGGFGNIGLQWRGVAAGSGLRIFNRALLRNPAPPATPSDQVQAGPTPAPAPPTPIVTTANANLLSNSQLNDGGFGKVGLQWHDIRVGQSVDVGSQSYLVQPLPSSGPPPIPTPGNNHFQPTKPFGSPTNTGFIRASQFNDGGFGDVGQQWWNVGVGGRLGVTTSNLTVQPEQNGVELITIDGLNFTQGLPVPAAPGDLVSAALVRATASPSATPAPVPAGNEATSSGRIRATQFNDGGFGDVGLQWMGVLVRGDATTVHNSLSIQPENVGQGLITVSNIQFPSSTVASPPTRPGPRQAIAPSPPLVNSGGQIPRLLTRPTRPFVPFPGKNEATNSGNIIRSQFADGGFGDVGLQWHDVRVGGNVGIVHNSLSIQPQGTLAAGINVANVSFGKPFVPAPPSRANVGFTTLPSLTVTPPPQPNQEGGGQPPPNNNTNQGGSGNGAPPNRRFQSHRQLSTSGDADVLLQWDIVRLPGRGLVIVHNILQVGSAGPTTGPVILKDISFPGAIPPLKAPPTPNQGGGGGSGGGTAPQPPVVNAATNSGILSHNQFSAGGFGDIGLQWRDVQVVGPVTIVHNTLTVNATGTGSGPINVSNVIFNSGAFDHPLPGRRPHLIVSPPKFLSRLPRPKPGPAPRPGPTPSIPDNSVNSGILLGGQYAAGGNGHILLQWRGIHVRGQVTIIDNILSVKTSGPATSPVTIQHVIFG